MNALLQDERGGESNPAAEIRKSFMLETRKPSSRNPVNMSRKIFIYIYIPQKLEILSQLEAARLQTVC